MAATSNDGFLIPYRVISITDKTHKSSYPAISPSRPALSQAGRTVLVTGGSGGIGYGIALAFATAGADKVIIVGREEAKQKAAAAKLAQEAGPESQTKFEGRAALPNKPESIDSLWDSLEAEGVHVDVLVLNAAVTGSAATSSMWNAGWEAIWEQFIVHVRSLNHYSERFKNSGVLLLQQLARDTPVSKMQIVNFHPGAILSPGAKSHGATERSLNWDDISLPSSVAVWAASDEAAFLHGRFIWSAWDVEELQSGQLRERIEKDEQYLRIGVHGV